MKAISSPKQEKFAEKSLRGAESKSDKSFKTETKKRTGKSVLFFLYCLSVTALFGFAAFDFARLFVVTAITQFFEGSLLVKLLFEPTQSAVYDLTFFDTDFGMHWDSPPFNSSELTIFLNIPPKLNQFKLLYLKNSKIGIFPELLRKKGTVSTSLRVPEYHHLSCKFSRGYFNPQEVISADGSKLKMDT